MSDGGQESGSAPGAGSVSSAGPLAGVRVLDLSRLVAGNQLTMLLGDFGAEVIKVEQPGRGDTLRNWTVKDSEIFWKVYARNKRSIALDLKNEQARQLLLRLVQVADVLVESFRPGTLERLGLAPATLLERNPKLIVTRISGWGQTGSMSTEPGFGTLIEAMSGLAAMNGFADREPVLPPGALADMISGTYGAFSVLAALRHVEAGGPGQVIDLSLFEPLFSVLGPQAAAYQLTGKVPERTGSRSTSSAPRNVYQAADGQWLALSGSTQTMAERIFRTIGRPELIDDPRFGNNAARLRHVGELDAILGDYFGAHTLEVNLARMRAAGVTVAPVMDIAGLMQTEYFRTRDVVTNGPDADGTNSVPMQAVVPRMGGTPGGIRAPAPALGQHNKDIVTELVPDADWDELNENGVFG
ncbi:CoA transferase [Saxibacter everestensis]|uniref:CoA transferase n=1 Tax=Saxibacter everestensis TaxID=2909229 RepID=A0ABY8QSU0_9MICO|nr:CoA transferase [Brevibacteriaceae bacterium ZFBP1038]